MLEYRRLKKSESYSYHLLMADAYKGKKPSPDAVLSSGALKSIRGLFDNGALKSALTIRDFRMYIGGAIAPMGGIAGVGTFSDARRAGYAAELLTRCIDDMNNLGYAVSMLFPFSYRYYRKFGWELAGQSASYSIVNRQNLPPHPEASLVRAMRARDKGRLTSCYDGFARAYTGMLRRDNQAWKQKFRRWKKVGDRVYLIEERGRTIGYLTCQMSAGPAGRIANVDEFVARNARAVRACIGFLAREPRGIAEVRLRAPARPLLWEFLHEPYCATSVLPLCQFRIVNLARALMLRGYDAGVRASLVVRLTDETAPWNAGTWAISVSRGRAAVRRVSSAPHVVMDQRPFVQLYMGYLSLRDLRNSGRAKVKNPAAFKACDAMFGGQRQYILDHF
jgi:predicted acetyltransferase